MNLAKRWAARIRSRARQLSFRARLATAALATVVAAGALWLTYEALRGGPVMLAVSAEPMSSDELAAASRLARKHGVAYRIDAGALLVHPGDLDRFRALLAEEQLPRPKVRRFEQVVKGGDIWLSPSQKERQWQTFKMMELSRQVSEFPAVRSATVMLEPGTRGGLGRSAVPPTASVKLTMADGHKLTARLAMAIADLVCGSSAGMERQNVRIVADPGQSMRFDANGAPLTDDPTGRLREAEAYHLEKIREALRYIDDVIVGVCVVPEDPLGGCRCASVCVPRSYLVAVHRTVCPQQGDPNDAALEAFAAPRLARIRHAVASLIGAPDANAVNVDWYDDIPRLAAEAGAAGTRAANASDPSGGDFLAASIVASLAGLGILCGLLAWRRRARRRAAAVGEPAGDGAAAAEADAGDGHGGSPLAVLQQAGGEQLLQLLRGEHPQTIALILAHVEPVTAATVLGRIDRDRQVEVTRRIAELGQVDAEVVAEVARGLTARYGADEAVPPDRAGGVGRVARILHHVGYATEKVVLDGLTGQQPALAESIRKRMFAFEDVALLPAGLLRTTLESLGRDELAIALRTAGKDVKEKVLSSLSRPAAREVREEMERIGPVRLSDVEAAQDRVLAAVRQAESGRYVSAPAARDSGVLA